MTVDEAASGALANNWSARQKWSREDVAPVAIYPSGSVEINVQIWKTVLDEAPQAEILVNHSEVGLALRPVHEDDPAYDSDTAYALSKATTSQSRQLSCVAALKELGVHPEMLPATSHPPIDYDTDLRALVIDCEHVVGDMALFDGSDPLHETTPSGRYTAHEADE